MDLYNRKGMLYVVEDTAFCGGGEGDNHHIIQPSSYNHQFIIKLYKKPTPSIQKKIEFMAGNNPFSGSQTMIQQAFAWPEEAIYDSTKNFVGFRMIFIDGGETLEKMCTMRSNYTNAHLIKYNFSSSDYFKNRLNLSYKICRAYDEFHSAQAFQFVGIDIKPANIMIQKDGNNVTIIDLDTIQISDNNGNVNFESNNVVTPEYVPPEYQNKHNQKFVFQQNWDSFSICVMLYQILFGLHPFSGSLINAKRGQTIEELIAKKYFPNGKNKSQFLKIPKPHQNFAFLSHELQNLFINAFEGDPDDRPTMKEMANVLLKEIQNKKTKLQTGNGNQPTPAVKNLNKQGNIQQGNLPNNTPLGRRGIKRVNQPVLPTFTPIAMFSPLSAFSPIATGISAVNHLNPVITPLASVATMISITAVFSPLHLLNPMVAQLSPLVNKTPITMQLSQTAKLLSVTASLSQVGAFNSPTNNKQSTKKKKEGKSLRKVIANISSNIQNKAASIFW